MGLITAKHSFNSGDILTVLPGLKYLAEKNKTQVKIFQLLDLPADYGHNNPHPVTKNGVHVCMNEGMYKSLKPLLESQNYIHSFEIWKGEAVDFNFDLTRHHSQMPLPGGRIHSWPTLIFPQLECSLNDPWIDVPPDFSYENKVCLNFTERYRNEYISYFFLKEYQDRCFFVGTINEWKIFIEKWGLHKIPYVHVNDFLELAKFIKGCKFTIGCQSFVWHLADAMQTPRILEICTLYPNTFPVGSNGYSFITQEALEFRFHQLLNEL